MNGSWRSLTTLSDVQTPRELTVLADLLSFFADRLKVQLREQGARHDLVDAVFALEGQDDLLLIVRRVEALGKFLDTEGAENFLIRLPSCKYPPRRRKEDKRPFPVQTPD